MTLTVSSGPGNGTVPSVVGPAARPRPRRRSSAPPEGRHASSTQSSKPVAAGEATRTDPGAGRDGAGRHAGDAVRSPPASPGRPFPTSIGESESAGHARRWTNAGLQVSTTTEPDLDHAPAGNVISQSPAPATARAAGHDRRPRGRQGADHGDGARTSPATPPGRRRAQLQAAGLQGRAQRPRT